jgi:hypothetical protein
MIKLISDPHSPYYSAGTKIAVITPPPFLDNAWRTQHVAWALREGRATTAEEAVYGSERDSKITREYALACVSVAEETGVECVDVHTDMIQVAGGSSEDLLLPYFTYVVSTSRHDSGLRLQGRAPSYAGGLQGRIFDGEGQNRAGIPRTHARQYAVLHPGLRGVRPGW